MNAQGVSRSLLAQMLDAAKRRMVESGLTGDQVAVVPQSRKAVEMQIFFCPSMMEAAEIYYDRDTRGWVCNFHLSGAVVDQGGPEVFGSPSAAPLATEQDAFDWGVKTLAVLLANEVAERDRLA